MSTQLSQNESSTVQQQDTFSISQLINKNAIGSSYNWLGVLDFLHQQYKQTQLKESEWALEKYLLQTRTKELEGIVQGLEKIVTDIGRRCKMLEVALRQERLKHQKIIAQISNGGNLNDITCPNFVGSLLQENMDPQLGNIQQVPKRRAKQYRPLLQKILSEVGIQSIFSPPGSPKLDNLSNRPSALMQTPNQHASAPQNNSGNQSPINRSQQQVQQQPQGFGGSSSNTFQTTQAQFGQPSEGSSSFSFNIKKQQGQTQHSKQASTVQNLSIQSQSRIQNQSARQEMELSDGNLQLKVNLRSHLDAVRDAQFFPNIPVMVSASEDCQIKLWDLNQMREDQHIEPYLSLREHTGPVFAVSALELNRSKQGMTSPYLVFSAGSEGTIKCWQVPLPDEFDTYGATEQYQQCFNSWVAHNDAIWQLKVNQQEQLLLSSGADGIVKLWSVNDQILVNQEPKATMIYTQKNQYQQTQDIPTSLCWSQNSQSFICGYAQQPLLQIFDIESARVILNLKYQSDQQFNQSNSISFNQNQPIIYSGHDDGKVRIFDLNNAHNDCVTSIVQNGLVIYTASHDCKIKTWDLRKYQVISEQIAHGLKYDESIHQLAHHQNQNLIASCGADGIIKIYSTKQ